MTKIQTYTVNPINSIEEIRSDYSYVYSYINDTTIPLVPENDTKEVQIVKYDKDMTMHEIIMDMTAKGLKLASPNALLGFAKEHFDVIEKNQWLVAPSSVFQDRDGDRCFLRVRRYDGERRLGLVFVGDYWYADYDWVFLAEPLDSNSETLSNSEPLSLTDEQCIEHLKSNGYKITKLIETEV